MRRSGRRMIVRDHLKVLSHDPMSGMVTIPLKHQPPHLVV